MFSHAADVFVLNHPRRPLLADLFMCVFFFVCVSQHLCESPLLLLLTFHGGSPSASLGPLSSRALFVLAPPGCRQRRGTWPRGTRQLRLFNNSPLVNTDRAAASLLLHRQHHLLEQTLLNASAGSRNSN